MSEPHHVSVDGLALGNDLPLVLIAGPCALESRAHALEVSAALVEICRATRHQADLQDLVRQGEPHLALGACAASGSTTGCRSSPKSARPACRC